MNLSAAIEAPRWHNQVSPNVTTLEVGPEGAPKELIKGLQERGQVVGLFDLNLGAAEGMSTKNRERKRWWRGYGIKGKELTKDSAGDSGAEWHVVGEQ
jgi:gamma-glutamyltranspeptidase